MVRARGGLLGNAYHASRRPVSSRVRVRVRVRVRAREPRSAPGPAVEWRSAEPLLLLPSRWRAGEASREAFREESGEGFTELTKEPPREVTGDWW